MSHLSLQGICHQPGGGLTAPDPLQNRGPSGGLRSRAAHLRGEVSAWWGEQLPHLLPCLPHHSGASRRSLWGPGPGPLWGWVLSQGQVPPAWQAEQSGAGGECHSVVLCSLPPQLIKLLIACDMPSVSHTVLILAGVRAGCVTGSVWKASLCSCWDALFKSTGRQHH